MKATSKDILRTVKHEKKRFISLAVISALGVIMLTGLKASCMDLKASADRFFDKQNLFDIKIQSTLGLTEEDVDALSQISELSTVEGSFSELVYTQNNGVEQTARIKILSPSKLNQPYVIDGYLPASADEIAVSKKYISDTGKKIGDTLTLSETEENTFEKVDSLLLNRTYTITGIVIDPTDINISEGVVSFRSTTDSDFLFFVNRDAIRENIIFSEINIQVQGTSKLNCYSDEYIKKIESIKSSIENNYMHERELARSQELRSLMHTEVAPATWYIQDRYSLSGYQNIKSDTDSIESIGRVFPIIFLLVAILISLTTATRMVEESRGLIGTYKALGYSEFAIRLKYTLFSTGASLIGGIIGDLGGFILFPKFVFTIFTSMYQLPKYQLGFDLFSGLGGVLLFVAAILLATYLACYEQLKHTPAALMRPLSPKAGKIIILERISFIWKKLSFLNKVTSRNIFRYKKRLFMTIGGIMGCTALLICGFAIKDSVNDLLPGQYTKIYKYDLIAVATNPEPLFKAVQGNSNVSEYQEIYTTNVVVTGKNNTSETVQIMVFPNDTAITDFIALKDAESGKKITLPESGITVTKNLSVILDFSKGENINLKTSDLTMQTVKVEGITTNYLGNTIYLSQSAYEQIFGYCQNNCMLMNLTDSCDDPVQFSDDLAKIDGVISSVSTESLKEDFDVAFKLIQAVIYIIIGFAACLAFVVLFTLSTTNISERARELSTIKVLGFFDYEVHLYVNKETLILTLLGILLGFPLGTILGRALTQAIKMPSIYFAVSIHPISYIFSGLLAFVFAIIVNFIANRFIDDINPVEALKSVE